MGGEGRYSQCGGSSRGPGQLEEAVLLTYSRRGQRHSLWKEKEEKSPGTPSGSTTSRRVMSAGIGQVPLRAAVPLGRCDLPCQPETQESEGKTELPTAALGAGRRKISQIRDFLHVLKKVKEIWIFQQSEFLAGADNWKK